MKAGAFDLRSSTIIPEIGVGIFDKKILMVRTTNNEGHFDILQTRKQAIVELFEEYFELKWRSALAPCRHHKARINA